MKIHSNHVITIEQAKSLLGDESAGLSSDEIQQLVEDFDMIAQYSIKMVQLFAITGSDTD